MDYGPWKLHIVKKSALQTRHLSTLCAAAGEEQVTFKTFNYFSAVTKLAYFADVFSELNRLNSCMQGCNTHAIQLYDRMEGFLKKKKRKKKFPSLHELGDFAVLFPYLMNNCSTLGGTWVLIWEIPFWSRFLAQGQDMDTVSIKSQCSRWQ